MTTKTFIIALTSLVFLYRCAGKPDEASTSAPGGDSTNSSVVQQPADDPALAKNLATFDTLDYVIFSGQQWTRLHESHANDIVVYWPDGRTTTGLDKHIEDLKVLFTYAPDTRIKEHPVKFGSSPGEWTCVTGFMEGTFTKPMVKNGKTTPPTGKSFKLPMCTVGHWKNGVMIEEYLYFDNKSYMEQMGVTQ